MTGVTSGDKVVDGVDLIRPANRNDSPWHIEVTKYAGPRQTRSLCAEAACDNDLSAIGSRLSDHNGLCPKVEHDGVAIDCIK